jgi:hypothetical protein
MVYAYRDKKVVGVFMRFVRAASTEVKRAGLLQQQTLWIPFDRILI